MLSAVNTGARIGDATPVSDEPRLAPAAPARAAAVLPAVDTVARVGLVRAAERQRAQQRLGRQRRRTRGVQPVVGAHVVQAHLRAQEPLHGLH